MAIGQEKTETTGGEIGLGVDVTIKLKQLPNLISQLDQALRQTGSALSGAIGDVTL